MPDRLNDLRRQRALVQEQLTWIDQEISALTESAQENPIVSATPIAPSVPSPTASPFRPTGAPLPDFPEYQADRATLEQEARRGCLKYAVLGFILFFAALTVIYFAAYRDHPLFSAVKETTK